ncbi:MAG: GNAT family N-acetyltransferase [Planctomycetes bacterium]|nr:GNAT family N-acetyltransferase [Planctomycetota bacterium]
MATEFVPPTEEVATLRTERLVVRPVRLDDAQLVHPHASDPQLTRYLTWAPHRDIGDSAAFLRHAIDARARGSGWVWSIFEGGQFRGVVGVESIARGRGAIRYDRAELGYWIGRTQHGRGIATEAAAAAVAFGFRHLALHKIVVRAATENPASLRVIAKLGFARVGVMRQDHERDGVWLDVEAFEMLATDTAAADLQRRVNRGR